jgi:hypothetical protein
MHGTELVMTVPEEPNKRGVDWSHLTQNEGRSFNVLSRMCN